MNRTTLALFTVAAVCGLAPSTVVAQRIERGELGKGDETLTNGEYRDVYSFQGQSGQHVVVTLSSSDFDTFLILLAPSGKDTQNDDDEGNNRRSRIDATLDESGEWRVVVTSYGAGEAGRYELAIDLSGSGAAGRGPMGGVSGGALGGQPGGARVERGSLAKGDRTLSSGEYTDEYTFQGVPGQRVRVDLRSSQFDTYLMVTDPSGEQSDNDDAAEGATDHSMVELTMVAGEYRVVVTSFESGESGDYEVTITMGGGGRAGSSKDQAGNAGGVRNEPGRLEQGDETLSSGEFIDIHTFEGRQGQQVILDLRSQDFDPYLIFRGPNDQTADNDDHEGDATRSLLSLTLEADGTYRVGVTSYKAGETGQYALRMDLGGGTAVASGPIREQGTLAAGDDTLRTGEYADAYRFQGTLGQEVTVDLQANDFDTYVILVPPQGDQVENDDEGGTNRSLIRHTLTEPGEYRVLVTSYAPKETGSYRLEIQFVDREQTVAQANERQRDVSALTLGQPVTGRLESGDGQLDNGEYRDMYVFEGQAGQAISVEMTSSDFDTYLLLVPPSGEAIQNDDHEGSQQRSQIDLTLREAGRYRVAATSYAAEATGAYQLAVRGGAPQAVAAPPRAPQPRAAQPAAPSAAAGTGQVYGVFAGISDYGGRAGNLPYTADDAVRVRDAMIQGAGMRPGDGLLLQDAQATAGAIRDAVQSLAGRMGPNDTFVFFYSGHGGRRPRQGAFQSSDPDNMDETLEFFDAGVTDDQFNEWMNGLGAGRVLLLLDACFSGGFSKDVISRPGRMGMFSSEEDVTSSVAAKFRAGGYLAVFLADAIQDRLADGDGDGQISAIELSQYVHERYRADLKSAEPGEFVRTGGPQLGFQHLVVDRGSIGPYDILFR
ncbi:MAG TPA: pre-peptidase C-terminal domain-containing protein [Gemmatimonadales bacterium]